jgi:hypothetical protein
MTVDKSIGSLYKSNLIYLWKKAGRTLRQRVIMWCGDGHRNIHIPGLYGWIGRLRQNPCYGRGLNTSFRLARRVQKARADVHGVKRASQYDHPLGKITWVHSHCLRVSLRADSHVIDVTVDHVLMAPYTSSCAQ